MRIAVTGAAGFIGQAFSRHALAAGAQVHGIDKLTYAANPVTVAELEAQPGFTLHRADIAEPAAMRDLIRRIAPQAVIHLAAETHVDRSIDHTAPFVATNIVGTHSLLEAALDYCRALSPAEKAQFRFLHVSTDEVYGALGAEDSAFAETSVFAPNSPYAASKASAEHLARAWHHTYGLPVMIGNCSNNYGPYQFPEKLIPNMILKALHGEPLPVYGHGKHVRDWLYVDDHAEALWLILTRGKIGEKYHIGGKAETANLALVETICAMLDAAMPGSSHRPHRNLINFVADRPGHDFRYAMNIAKIERELGWRPKTSMEDGLQRTLDWYLARRDWWQGIRDSYAGERLGLGR
ncbi:MAG: dTDP-glucose 4,6-dehydratase [Alphaproteobacteria bacterium]